MVWSTEQRDRQSSKKEILLMAPPHEPLVQIQNDFKKLFLMMYSTKIVQMVLLCSALWLPEL